MRAPRGLAWFMRSLPRSGSLALLLFCAPSPSAAQGRLAPEAAFLPPRSQLPDASEAGGAEPGPGPAAAFLYSLVLPGGGQYALGQRRWIAYLAAEAAALAFLLDRRGEGIDRRNDYRDLAWATARAGAVPRVDPAFEYYERLSKWTRSGAFDSDPLSAGLQPEADPATYNGSVWALAQSIYPLSGGPPEADPNHQRAVAYYRGRAYADSLAWDWSSDEAAHHRFQDLIERSDDAFRTATVAAGLLLSNHVLSATDAFVTARLRRVSGGRISGTLGVEPAGIGVWRLGLSLAR